MRTIVKRRRRFAIGPGDNGIRMTPAEFDAIDDYNDLYRYELINGVLIVNAAPSRFERDPNEEMGRWIRNYQEQHPGIVQKTLAEEYVHVENGRRRADRAIWAGYGPEFNLDADLPTIVVEFVSRRRRDCLRDYVDKRDEYLALGIREYWVIDRFQETMSVFRPSSLGFEEQIVSRDQTYATSLLPGFELPLGKLLAVCDDWKQPSEHRE
ncbi:MAG: Uma2 family endonuclease [Planctomycetales bacterium]